MDKKIQITVIVCSVIGSLILNVIENKRRQKELEGLEKINKMVNKIGEDFQENIRKSSEKVREDAEKLWDSKFDYDVEVYDILMNRIESTIFSTRKEAEDFRDERKKKLGSKYLVIINSISHNEEE